MPRRKLTTISLKELDTYSALIEELQNNNPAYSDKDLTTLKLTVLDNYEATIKEVDKAIKYLHTMLPPRKILLKYFKASNR